MYTVSKQYVACSVKNNNKKKNQNKKNREKIKQFVFPIKPSGWINDECSASLGQWPPSPGLEVAGCVGTGGTGGMEVGRGPTVAAAGDGGGGGGGGGAAAAGASAAGVGAAAAFGAPAEETITVI